jgi:2'-5' RNA ligase
LHLVLARAAVGPRGSAVLQRRAAPPALTHLQRALGGALQVHGVPLEARPWQPHVTLARRAEGALAPDDGRALRWRVRGYVLVESQLGSNGGYRVLRRYG